MVVHYFCRGIVCYGALHYVVFLFDWCSMSWILYDDAKVEELQDWGAVLELCRAGPILPSILLYERMNHAKFCNAEGKTKSTAEGDLLLVTTVIGSNGGVITNVNNSE